MAKKHTVTLPDGKTGRRTSENRTYPYAIAVGPLTKEQQVDDYNERIARAEAERDRLLALAEYLENDGELVVRQSNSFGFHREYVLATGILWNGNVTQNSSDRGIGTLGWDYDGHTVDEMREKVALRSREFAATAQQQADGIRERIGMIVPDRWRVAAWSSRPELAEARAQQARAADPRRSVLVLETDIDTL